MSWEIGSREMLEADDIVTDKVPTPAKPTPNPGAGLSGQEETTDGLTSASGRYATTQRGPVKRGMRTVQRSTWKSDHLHPEKPTTTHGIHADLRGHHPEAVGTKFKYMLVAVFSPGPQDMLLPCVRRRLPTTSVKEGSDATSSALGEVNAILDRKRWHACIRMRAMPNNRGRL